MEPDPRARIMEFVKITQYGLLWHCICAISRLEIPDIIGDNSLPVSKISALAGVQGDPLLRVLRFLADYGFVAIEDDLVRLTAAGELLRSGHPASMWTVFAATGAADVAHALTGSLRTGRPAADEVLGMGFWDYLGSHPAEQRTFNALMRRHVQGIATACVANLEWPTSGTVADVGGGVGVMLASVLHTSPDLHGILVEQSQVLEEAHDYLSSRGVSDRCELRQSSLFAPVPEADVYILSFVLHDWDDANAQRILLTLSHNARQGSALRIIERVIPDNGTRDDSKRSDVSMLLLTGGRERTLAEYQSLLGRTGWQVAKTTPVHESVQVIQANRVKDMRIDDALLLPGN